MAAAGPSAGLLASSELTTSTAYCRALRTAAHTALCVVSCEPALGRVASAPRPTDDQLGGLYI
jgi:hypothetical protein